VRLVRFVIYDVDAMTHMALKIHILSTYLFKQSFKWIAYSAFVEMDLTMQYDVNSFQQWTVGRWGINEGHGGRLPCLYQALDLQSASFEVAGFYTLLEVTFSKGSLGDVYASSDGGVL
jgi:hypothetical protein